MRFISFYASVCVAFAFASLSNAATTFVCDNISRWNADVKIDFRSKGRKISIGSTECMPNGVKWDPWNHAPQPKRPQKPVACSSIPADGRLTRVEISAKPTGYRCDHVVELNWVKDILEATGGPCDQVEAAHGTPEFQAMFDKLVAIRTLTYQPNNMHFLLEKFEKLKGRTVNSPAATMRSASWFDFNEVYDYFKGSDRPGRNGAAVAAQLDKAIASEFHGLPPTAEPLTLRWAKLMAELETIYATKLATATAQQKTANAKESGGGKKGSGSGSAPVRMVRRHTSGFTPTEGVESSLTRRARGKRGAARSGSHAPKNRCCPAKNQPQKKVVPRSQTKRRPPPTKKPRRPTQQPKPRQPSPRKKVAKRPASRARRQPGVQQKPKRTAPKRKPRTVPKPTRRPRGKPRQRRRRR